MRPSSYARAPLSGPRSSGRTPGSSNPPIGWVAPHLPHPHGRGVGSARDPPGGFTVGLKIPDRFLFRESFIFLYTGLIACLYPCTPTPQFINTLPHYHRNLLADPVDQGPLTRPRHRRDGAAEQGVGTRDFGRKACDPQISDGLVHVLHVSGIHPPASKSSPPLGFHPTRNFFETETSPAPQRGGSSSAARWMPVRWVPRHEEPPSLHSWCDYLQCMSGRCGNNLHQSDHSPRATHHHHYHPSQKRLHPNPTSTIRIHRTRRSQSWRCGSSRCSET